MENYYVLSSGDDLYHWGIKGMRWGVRRYQNKDGSLTAAGQKRRDKLQAKLDKIEGTEKMKNSGKTTKKIGDMTDEELSEYITRKNAEKLAYGLERDIANLNPKKVSAGEQFVSNMKNELAKGIADAGNKAVKELMNKAVEKALGNGSADVLGKLKKEAEAAGYEKIKSEARRAAAEAIRAEREANKKDDPVDAELVKAEREAKLADYEKRKTEAKASEAKLEYQKLVNDGQSKRNQSLESATPTSATSKETATDSPTAKSSTTQAQSSSTASTSTPTSTPTQTQPTTASKPTTQQQSTGRDFVDSRGNVLFTTASSNTSQRDAGKAFVDSRGNILFSVKDDD